MENPESVPPDHVVARLGWRYATKKFDPSRKIPAETWAALEEAVRLAPSSYGLQPWKFVVVTDDGLRKVLRQNAWDQPQVTDSSHLVVFAARNEMTEADVDRYVRRTYEVRKSPPGALDGFRKMMLGSIEGMSPAESAAWNEKQVYLALGVMLSAAAMSGVDACPMEGLSKPDFDRILGLDGYHSVVMATFGYRAAEDELAAKPKVRFAPDDVFLRRS